MMQLLADVLTGCVGVMHIGFLLLEMFGWQKPIGLRVFHNTPEYAAATAAMAGNQGLYNGFLAAGLLWGVASADGPAAYSFKVFFLGCVIVAGIYGAATVSKRILWIQAAPAALALGLQLASAYGH